MCIREQTVQITLISSWKCQLFNIKITNCKKNVLRSSQILYMKKQDLESYNICK